MLARGSVTVLEADEPGKRRIGFVMKEEVGVAAYNPAALSRFPPKGVVVVRDEEFIATGCFPESLRLPEEWLCEVRA